MSASQEELKALFESAKQQDLKAAFESAQSPSSYDEIPRPEGVDEQQWAEMPEHVRRAAYAESRRDPNEAPRMAQIGRGYMDVAQGAKQLGMHIAGSLNFLDPEQVEAYDKQLKTEIDLYNENNPNFQPLRVVGNFAAAGGTLAPAATTVKGMIGLGTLFGVLQPVTDGSFAEQKAIQGAMGAALAPLLGKGLPWATKKGVDFVKFIGRPLSAKGREQDVIDLFTEVLGPDQAKVAQALADADPNLTVGQALAGASMVGDDIGHGLVKLEHELKRVAGTGHPLRKIYEAAKNAREKAISAIAKTDDDMAKAIQARDEVTRPLYDAIQTSRETVNTIPVLNQIDEIITMNPKNDAIVKPLSVIRNKLMDKNKELAAMLQKQAPDMPRKQAGLSDELADLDTNVTSLVSVSDHIKTMMESTKKGADNFDLKVLSQIKKQLDKQIGYAEKAFEKAQSEFKRLSVPINQMNVGRELEKRLLNVANDQETPGMYLRAISDSVKTLKTSTGFARYKGLSDVMDEEQVKAIMKVGKELEREGKRRAMAGEVSGIMKDLGAHKDIELPHLLSRPVVVTNAILKTIGKHATTEYNKVATELLANPQRLAKLLSDPPRTKSAKIARKIYRNILPKIAVQTASRAESTE